MELQTENQSVVSSYNLKLKMRIQSGSKVDDFFIISTAILIDIVTWSGFSRCAPKKQRMCLLRAQDAKFTETPRALHKFRQAPHQAMNIYGHRPREDVKHLLIVLSGRSGTRWLRRVRRSTFEYGRCSAVLLLGARLKSLSPQQTYEITHEHSRTLSSWRQAGTSRRSFSHFSQKTLALSCEMRLCTCAKRACINHKEEHIFLPESAPRTLFLSAQFLFFHSPLAEGATGTHEEFLPFRFCEKQFEHSTAGVVATRLPLRARETAQSLLVAENEGDNFLFSPWLPNGLAKTKGRMRATSQEKDSFFSDMITKGVVNFTGKVAFFFPWEMKMELRVAFLKVIQRGAAHFLWKKSSFCRFI